MDHADDTFYDDADSDTESTDDIEFEEGSEEIDQYPFHVLSIGEIVQLMADTVNETNIVVKIPATITRILLIHFKWDKEKLMERFFDGNQEALYREAHVVNPARRRPAVNRNRSQNLGLRNGSNVTEECIVCFTTLPLSELTGLECGHRFCKTCWSLYLQTQIIHEGLGQTITCLAPNCDIFVDDATVMNLINDPKVLSKYQHLITTSYVECNRLLRWCPAPNCDNAIKVHNVEMKPVTCKCSHAFCFKCGENWHGPIECRLLRSWLKRCSEDLESINWINAHTKQCPQCNAPIEKNGGCMHMTCRTPSCRHEFCWMCLAPRRHAGFHRHKCNVYHNAQNATNAQQSLERYLFYCTRYMNHKNSLKLENALYDKAREQMDLMQQCNNMSRMEVQFLKKAVDVLCSCRQTLMYTYAFAFYLRKSNQSVIFENNQSDLENATEDLSRYLERDITNEVLVDIKLKVHNKYRYCESRRQVLLKHVQEGSDGDMWDYVE